MGRTGQAQAIPRSAMKVLVMLPSRRLVGFVHTLAAATFAVAAHAAPLEAAGTIALPSVEGRLDHLAIDLAGRTLYVAARSAGSVEAVDLAQGKYLGRTARSDEPQGLAFEPTRRWLLIASGGGTLQALRDGRAQHSVEGLPDADNLRINSGESELLAGYASSLAVLDLNTLTVLRHTALPGHPEAFESEGRRTFVNVPEVGAVVVVDRATGKEQARWSLRPLAGNYAMALDALHHRLFVATRQPAVLVAMDTRTGAQLQRLALCSDADDLFFDAQRSRVYAVCGAGAVDVVDASPGGPLQLLQRALTSPGARTGLFVPQTRQLYVAAPRRKSSAAILIFRVE